MLKLLLFGDFVCFLVLYMHFPVVAVSFLFYSPAFWYWISTSRSRYWLQGCAAQNLINSLGIAQHRLRQTNLAIPFPSQLSFALNGALFLWTCWTFFCFLSGSTLVLRTNFKRHLYTDSIHAAGFAPSAITERLYSIRTIVGVLFLTQCFVLDLLYSPFAAFLLGGFRAYLCFAFLPNTQSLNWVSFCVFGDLLIFQSFPGNFSSFSWLFQLNSLMSLPGMFACFVLEFGKIEQDAVRVWVLSERIAKSRRRIAKRRNFLIPLLATSNLEESVYKRFSNTSVNITSAPTLSAAQISFLKQELDSSTPLNRELQILVFSFLCFYSENQPFLFPYNLVKPWSVNPRYGTQNHQERRIKVAHWIYLYGFQRSKKEWYYWSTYPKTNERKEEREFLWLEDWMWDFPLFLKFRLEETVKSLQRTFQHFQTKGDSIVLHPVLTIDKEKEEEEELVTRTSHSFSGRAKI